MEINQPLSFYTSSDRRPLLFHLIHVGEGLMFLLIFPDNKVLLFDCNVTEENSDRVLGYIESNIPFRYDPEVDDVRRYIDVFINSHRDIDHLRGLKKVYEKFPIKSIWDSGQFGNATESTEYQYYMRLRRSLVEKYGKNSVKIPWPSTTPFHSMDNVSIYCLNSSLDFEERCLIKEARIQHENSLVLLIKYKNKSIMFTGDSDWRVWRDKIIPNFENSELLKSNILIASHHGSRSFFTEESENDNIDPIENPDTTFVEALEYIQPNITLIPCGDYKTSHHPNKQALSLYKKNTSYKQVYSTNKKGTLAGFIDKNENWTVVPARFKAKNSYGNMTFDIICSFNIDNEKKTVPSKSYLPADERNLYFKIIGRGGLIDPLNKVKIIWEVSNGGIFSDEDKQDIYYKGSKEQGSIKEFCRQLSYQGRHLLRCTVKNRRKKKVVTKIFEVNGIKS